MADTGPADEARAQRRPSPRLAALALAEEVFLVVIEVRRQVPGVRLLRGRLVRPEVAAVRLGAFHQADVPEPRRGLLDHLDEVAQHRRVDPCLLRLGRLLLVGRIEDVGDVVQPDELRPAVARIEQVDRQEPSPAVDVIERAPGQADDLPAVEAR